MTIPADTEEIIRRAESQVNKVWNAWRANFDTKTSKEVLAMVAFQFAKKYYQLREYVDNQQAFVEEFEKELNRLLDIEVTGVDKDTDQEVVK